MDTVRLLDSNRHTHQGHITPEKASMATTEGGDLDIDSLLRKLEDAESKDAQVSDIPREQIPPLSEQMRKVTSSLCTCSLTMAATLYSYQAQRDEVNDVVFGAGALRPGSKIV